MQEIKEARIAHTIEVTPAICKPRKKKNSETSEETEEAALYSGNVVLRAPTWSERMRLPKFVGKGLDAQIALVEILPQYFIRSEIVRLADGRPFATLEEMHYDTDFVTALAEIAVALVKPYNLGNAQAPTT